MANNTVTFGSPKNFSVGTNPFSVLVGDFNKDGINDIATTNYGSNNVSVLLGKGNGVFGIATNFTVGTNPFYMSVGDFNGDNKLDLATANYGSNNISVLLGTGNGSFGTATNLAVGAGNNPLDITVGDFNKDGKSDLAVVNDTKSISILLGNGNGSFTTPSNLAVGTYPISVAVGDFNKDGISDLVASNTGSKKDVSILLGQANGGFGTATSVVIGHETADVTVGDFNKDGISDLAASNYKSNSVSILLGKGDGSFGTTTSFAVGNKPFSVRVGDFNGDGISDLVAVNNVGDNVSILTGKGNGSFETATNFAVGSSPGYVAVKDLNGDGSDDLVVTNRGSNDVSVLLSKTITAGINNAPVVANPISTQNIVSGTVLNFAIPVNTFTDPDAGDVLSYTAKLSNGNNLPTWLTFNPTTKTFGGTPAIGDVGNVTIAITATDKAGLKVDSHFDINVTPGAIVNRAPVVGNPISNKSIITGSALNFALPANTFTDPDAGDVLTYSAKLANGNNLPAWLSFNATTKTFGGTPAIGDVGSLTVAVTATDKAGLTVSSNFGVNVTAAVVNRAPVVGNPISAQSIITGKALNFALPANAFTDPDAGDVLTYTAKLANGNNLPTWLTFNPTTKTFAGTPAIGDVGNLTVAVTATDKAGLKVSSNFGVNVTAAVITPQPPTVNTTQATFNVTRSADYDNHVGFYKIENAEGAIISKTGVTLKPGDAGYLEAAVQNRLTNVDLIGVNGQTIASRSTAQDGAIYAPLLFSNSKPDSANLDLSNVYTAYTAANSDKAEHIRSLGNGTFSFEDSKGGGDKDFNDLIVKANFATAPIVSSQDLVLDVVKLNLTPNNSTTVNLNLTAYAGQTLKTDITTNSSANYSNNIGFYTVEDSIGSIKLSNGNFIKPGDANYAVEAIKNALANSLQADNSDAKTGLSTAGGKIYAPVVVAQGTLNEFVSKNPTNGGGANDIHAYFTYVGANSDKTDHFRMIGNNTFGVEDMYGGGDKDFNDLVVTLNVKSA